MANTNTQKLRRHINNRPLHREKIYSSYFPLYTLWYVMSCRVVSHNQNNKHRKNWFMYFFPYNLIYYYDAALQRDDSPSSPHIPLNWSTCTCVSANCCKLSWLDFMKVKWNIFVYSLCPQPTNKLLSSLMTLRCCFWENYSSKKLCSSFTIQTTMTGLTIMRDDDILD